MSMKRNSSVGLTHTVATFTAKRSSVLRHAGYIIGRGVRVVEWDVSEHPEHPDGDLVSLKLRALTPDGIRMAIAKEYGLSNYREVMLQLKLVVYTSACGAV